MTTTEPRRYPFNLPEGLELHPNYAWLRESEPVARIKMPYGEEAWLVTRYEDVKLVLGDPRFSRAAAQGKDEPRTRPEAIGNHGLIALDPPNHTRLRKLAAKAFTARRVETLRPRAVEIANSLLDAMLARGAPGELVEDYALPLPITVICELLGVPVEDHPTFREWTVAFLSTTKLSGDEIMGNIQRIYGYMGQLIGERRAAPRDDLISAMIQARDADDRLSDEELVQLSVDLLTGGFETTASQIPNFVYMLLTNPDQLAVLKSDRGLIPGAVEELLRHVPLGVMTTFPRYALEDVRIGDVTVRAGEPVIASVSAANRDASVVPGDPDAVDVTRSFASHVGFGHGAHHCIGAQLARMELRVAIETLLERLPDVRFWTSEDDIVWKSGTLTRGPSRLPITWGTD